MDHASPCSIVAELSKLRQFMFACNSLNLLAIERTPAAALADQAVEIFSRIGFDIRNQADLGINFRSAGVNFMNSIGADKGSVITTGIAPFDELTGGFHPGEVIIFTAETGVGKTLLAQQVRRNACSTGQHTLYCSGEMFAHNLVARELAAAAGIKPGKMRNPERLRPDERLALIEAISHECENCRILDGDLSLSRIRLASRQMHRTIGLNCIVIDYDELVEVPGKDELEQLRRLVRESKSLAFELKCPVIVISQLRKALQGEDRKHPTLQRLYGSGAKAKHASIIAYVDRPFVQELKGNETEARLLILKSRDGRTGQVPLRFDIHKLQFFAETNT